jgi:hypothetical protein
LRDKVKELALEAKGFLTEAEGMRLFDLAVESARLAPCLEIGSYCGKSTLFLAEGCRVSGQHPLFAIDHHRGSEEQQFGQDYFDPEIFDAKAGIVNTLDRFVENIRKAGLEDWVIPIMAHSHHIGRYWSGGELGLVFIDGGHSELDVFRDFYFWSPQVLVGGYLCIHDIFADPAEGGQAPYRIFQFAQLTGCWEYIEQLDTLGVLRKR